MSGKIYFFSDIHLGLPDADKSREREKKLVRLIDEVKSEAEAFFFVGDIFDFWWEYKHVVPRGYVRFLGKIAELTDAGVPVHFFAGNHDVWYKSYGTEELGVRLYYEPTVFNLHEKKIYIAHGDGLGPGDRIYKILKKFFTNKPLQWLYSRLHPNFAFGLAYLWSHSNRKKEKYIRFEGEDKELLFLYAEEILGENHFDYFIFGHRHIALIRDMSAKSKIANIGEWFINYTFLELDKGNLTLKTYRNDKIEDFVPDLSKPQNNSVFN